MAESQAPTRLRVVPIATHLPRSQSARQVPRPFRRYLLRGDTQGAFTHPTESARNGVVTVSVSKAWNRLLDDGDEDLALADIFEGDTSGFGA
jgi:hypothetical protein